MSIRSWSVDPSSLPRSSPVRSLPTAEKTEPTLRGYAALFNSRTTLFKGKLITITEVIRPGAFRDALRENQDVILNFNHNNDYILARTKSGTLRLAEDDRGLRVVATLLDSQWNRDRIIGPASRGDLVEMSFAFLPRPGGVRETRTEDRDTGRVTLAIEVLAVDLFDVSVVYKPAYEGTRFSVRSLRPSTVRAMAQLDGLLDGADPDADTLAWARNLTASAN